MFLPSSAVSIHSSFSLSPPQVHLSILYIYVSYLCLNSQFPIPIPPSLQTPPFITSPRVKITTSPKQAISAPDPPLRPSSSRLLLKHRQIEAYNPKPWLAGKRNDGVVVTGEAGGIVEKPSPNCISRVNGEISDVSILIHRVAVKSLGVGMM